MSQDAIEFDGDRQDATLKMLGPKPRTAGDSIEVCVAPTALRGLAKFWNHKLEIAGLVAATYCKP